MSILLADAAMAALAGAAGALALLAAWAVADRRTAAAARVRRAWRSGVVGPALLIVLGTGAFAVVAEDVLRRDHTELWLRLDRWARGTVRDLGASREVRATAKVTSRLTGEGLVVAVGVAALALGLTGRRRDAVVLLVGTLSAWGLVAVLKLGFAVARPKPGRPTYAITGYGFPSGHAFVVVVACGLAAWVAGRHASPGVRLLLGLGVVLVAGLSATSRVILNAHWLSDVAAGISGGAVWLGLVILAASARRAPAS